MECFSTMAKWRALNTIGYIPVIPQWSRSGLWYDIVANNLHEMFAEIL